MVRAGSFTTALQLKSTNAENAEAEAGGSPRAAAMDKEGGAERDENEEEEDAPRQMKMKERAAPERSACARACSCVGVFVCEATRTNGSVTPLPYRNDEEGVSWTSSGEPWRRALAARIRFGAD
jgi:hypothetical protein